MSKRKFNGEIAKRIILTMAGATAVTGLAVTLAIMPGLGLVIKELMDWYGQENSQTKFRIRKTFEDLRRARLIKCISMPDKTIKIILTEGGSKLSLQYNLDQLRIEKPQKWDRLWRFIIFDIPNSYNRERRYFRLKLKSMGFYQLQKSVWIYPYNCKKEIDFVSEYLRISPYIRIAEVKEFDGSSEAQEYFF